MILFPAAFGALAFILPSKSRKRGLPAALLLGNAVNLGLNIYAYGQESAFSRSWGGFGIDFSLRLYNFSGFILICAAALSFFVAFYTVSLSKDKDYNRFLYTGMLFTSALVNGAVLADNLVVMLFFWEAILATMFIMIMAGGKKSYKTSVKAVIIAGITDLCMMMGIGLTGYLAKTLDMQQIHLPLNSWGLAAFILLTVGAVSKAGSMPFHTWIPDAADDAPTPFMPFMPGCLEKLLGIYLLSRICMDLFEFEHGSPMSYALMTLGVCTILFAVMMALIQRDFKRLLSYHAVSQVGYMILGVGTGLPVGIVGAVFHMLNNAVYKCCLFLTAGAVEKQTGTTNLNKLGGLGKKMPVTMICFLVSAASIAGFPMTNGFFSKELIFDGAIESGIIFYIIAAIGAFFTPISFLKLGHAAFFGKPTKKTEKVKEAPWPMLAPMLAMSVFCLALGFGNSFVINRVLQPVLHIEEHITGHTNWLLVGISAGLLLLAALDHFRGFKKTGKGIESADHYHHAPVLRTVYNMAEKKYFDPYEVSTGLIKNYGNISLKINDGISWFYDVFIVGAVEKLSGLLKRAHNGNQARYVIWILGGVVVIALLFLIK
ncbi:MAG: complex I subunit 5 family protein [Oscillospiraceae bacterium]|nr:complex I subunit 5 family protein [Oscillospiraceae bacterium]